MQSDGHEQRRMASGREYQWGEPPGPDSCPPGTIISPDTRRQQRLPPGQVRTRKWPILQAGQVLRIDPANWRLRVWGLVAEPRTWDWEQFLTLPRVRVFADFHCVEGWSRLGNLWEGVATRSIAELVRPLEQARFVMVYAPDGWTTNLPIEDFLAADALLALSHDGRPLEPEHGAPVRLVVPQRYAWKSAKWVTGIEFRADDAPGYWERAGYHMRGDPWLEQRREVPDK